MFIPILITTAIGICAIGVFLIILFMLPHAQAADQRERQIEAKITVDELRAKRLKQDLAVVENRAHLVASQEALVALRIEEKRRELGMRADSDNTAPPGSDSATW